MTRTGRNKTQRKSVHKPAATDAKVILLNKPFGYVSQFSGDGNTCLLYTSDAADE